MNAAEPTVPGPEGRLVAHKYQLERLLGEGGMACVWLARNLLLDMRVALKLLRPELASPETAARLRAEARAAAHFTHPAIIRVFDIEETPSGEPCIVMELLEGETLYERLEREEVGAVELVRLLLPIADALCFVHESGFIHRDLKPENIFLANVGGRVQPKLFDFGIAKEVGAQARPRSFSGTGYLVGSPGYMSPEQATGAELDERTDVWSLSVVLYEGLARRPAFVAETPTDVLLSVLRDEPAPLAGVDPALTRIVFNGLSKDRASRTPSLQRLRHELSEWLASQGELADPTQLRPPASPESSERRRARRPRWLWPGAALVGLSLLATAVAAQKAPPPPAPATVVGPSPTAKPVMLAPPPDLGSPPLLSETTEAVGATPERRTLPPSAASRTAAPPRPSAKVRESGPRPPKEPWGAVNPYGI
jgi:eukaryotic-like serine/threonine-protein kinase